MEGHKGGGFEILETPAAIFAGDTWRLSFYPPSAVVAVASASFVCSGRLKEQPVVTEGDPLHVRLRLVVEGREHMLSIAPYPKHEKFAFLWGGEGDRPARYREQYNRSWCAVVQQGMNVLERTHPSRWRVQHEQTWVANQLQTVTNTHELRKKTR